MSELLRYGDPEEVGMSARRLRGVDALARRWVEDGTHPALVVLVARRGVVVLHEAHGRLGPGPDSPPLPVDAIFPLSSLTKPITATCAMCLVEDGLLGLNRPVQEYLPEFADPGKEAVMVHHLLTHAAGLRDEDVEAHRAASAGTPLPEPPAGQHPAVHERLATGYGTPLWRPPGQEMSYCNFGYDLLGEIVRRVAGAPVEEVARERIFAPLGMADSHYSLPAALSRRVVRRPPEAPFQQLNGREAEEAPGPAGGAYSTARDMATFGQMFLDGGRRGDARVLSPASVREMTRNQIPGIPAHFFSEFFPEASWGLGWDVHDSKSSSVYGGLLAARAFGHAGAGGTLLFVDPTHDLVMLYFSVVIRERPDGAPIWNVDLFEDAATAAVVEAA
jgi:serine-type D-Ala-D-Ala carboxypeptidase